MHQPDYFFAIFQDGLSLRQKAYGTWESGLWNVVFSATLPYDLGESEHSPEESAKWEDMAVDAEPIVRP